MGRLNFPVRSIRQSATFGLRSPAIQLEISELVHLEQRLFAALRKFKSGCIQAQMGSANEDKWAAVARPPCFPPCSIILPREECRPPRKDSHQSCPGTGNRTRERQCRRTAGSSIGPASLAREKWRKPIAKQSIKRHFCLAITGRLLRSLHSV